ncbi:vomeronasal type-2 receptor 26-like [Protopterus annectens]|uniref:vomeronasal type-2 receptor 26-like n=1 Tax=Protopterus annectens TaxID=7888 RepID=UPI001CFBC03F|nr:vomeronasal type-2 receptor 26-like [Protopterus annectens]
MAPEGAHSSAERKILHYARNIRFRNQAGNEVFFDAKGDPPAVFDIISLLVAEDGTFKSPKVGSFDSSMPLGSDIVVNVSAITWNSDSPKGEMAENFFVSAEDSNLEKEPGDVVAENSVVKTYSAVTERKRGKQQQTEKGSAFVAADNVCSSHSRQKGEQQQAIPASVCSEDCSVGHRKASIDGQPICCFTCIPCAEGEIANQTGSTECLKCPDKEWPNEKQDNCIPKNIEFLSYEDALGVTLAGMSVFSALVSILVLIIFCKHNDTPIVRANNQTLSYLLLLSLTVCSLCSLVFIGQPNKMKCLLCQTIFGISFVVCVSCILAKTIMVVIAFKSTKPNSKLTRYIGPAIPNTVVFILTFLQLTLSSLWLSISPPFPEANMKSQMGKVILDCNEGSVIAFWCMLGYLTLLAIVSFIVAFLSRNLPDSFNEARYISFSMLVFVSVWLSFVPAYLSTKGKYMVAVEIFAILSSSMGVLLCIFAPKCYIILLHPEMNTKQYIMGRSSSQGR